MNEKDYIEKSIQLKSVPTLVIIGKQKCYYNFDELMQLEKLYMHFNVERDPIPNGAWNELDPQECVVYISEDLNQEKMIEMIKLNGGYSQEQFLFKNVNYVYHFTR